VYQNTKFMKLSTSLIAAISLGSALLLTQSCDKEKKTRKKEVTIKTESGKDTTYTIEVSIEDCPACGMG
jgi:hypothetical protein